MKYRYYEVERGFSYRVMFGYEREVIDQFSLYKAVTVSRKDNRGTKVLIAQNPYLVKFLKFRYKVYKKSIAKGHTLDEYAEAVRKWYKNHKFTDKKGGKSVLDVWKAIHKYRADCRDKYGGYIDSDWIDTPQKPYKSHHPFSEFGKEREREQRRAWRQSEVGRQSTAKSRQRAKLNRWNK